MMSYTWLFLLGITLLPASVLLLSLSYDSLTVLGSVGRVVGGLLLLPLLLPLFLEWNVD